MTDITLEKTLPTNLEAERLILGAILLEYMVPADLNQADFYLESHRKIYGAMTDLQEHGEPADIFTVKNKLQAKDELESCGGAAYLASLTDGLPRMEYSRRYIKAIRTAAAHRRLIQMSNEVMARAFQAEQDPREIASLCLDACDEINMSLEESAGLKPLEGFLSPVFAELEARAQRKEPTPYRLGFMDIDRILTLRAGNELVIAARPGHGKTAFMGNVITNLAKRKINCAVFSLEMGAWEIVERMIATEAEVSLSRMSTGFMSRDDWSRISRAAGVLSELPIWIDDSSSVAVSDMRSRMMRIKQGIQVWAVDYMQLVSPPERLRKNANEFEQMAAISKSLKATAKNMNNVLLAVSQLSRASERRKDQRPQLSDLRSSGQIEQDADAVAFLYREEVSNATEENHGLAEFILGKQRNGPIGTFNLAYVGEYTKFAPLYQETDSYPPSPAMARHWD